MAPLICPSCGQSCSALTAKCSIGSELEKQAIPVVRDQWFQKLNEALDFVERGSRALGEFRRRVRITGFSSDHHFQVNLLAARELIDRLKKWIPRFREET